MADSVEAFAESIVNELRALGDPARAEGEKRYFKHTIDNIGVTMPAIAALEKRLCGDLTRTWDVSDAMSLCESLMRRRLFEATLFALTFLERFAERMGQGEFERCERWLRDDLCDNWAATDSLCPHIIGTILERHPDLVPRVVEWAGCDNRWVRRGAAVSFVLLARGGRFLDAAYDVAERLIADKNDDLVQKGNGWMLREAGKADAERLEEFLLRHGPDIPRTTVRYAVEKFPPDRRSELLAATRTR